MGIDFNMIRATRIALTGLQNTRDLGGYPAFGGRRLRRGRLIRSGMLMRAREDDLKRLCGLHGLRTVMDFRTPMEAKQQPDPAMEGVRYIDNPLLDEASLGVTRESKPEFGDYVSQMLFYVRQAGADVGAYFERTYPLIATGDFAIRQLRRFFDVLLAQEEGAVLYHCTAGKDRVGTATALALSALGVERELILADFLFTNECLQAETDEMVRAARERIGDEAVAARLAALNSVQPRYLEAVFASIDEKFGSLEDYLRGAMGLDDVKRSRLRELYLE